MKKTYFYIILLIVGTIVSCEEDINLDLPSGDSQITVEGYIEQNLPPIVILTKTLPYFSNKNIEELQEAFVHDAIIKVNDGNKEVQLKEYSTKGLDSVAALVFGQIFNLSGSAVDTNRSFDFIYYVYTIDLNQVLLGEVGKTYSLTIETEGKIISSTTTIHQPLPPDSLWSMPHEDPTKDSLVSLWLQHTDPDSSGNYIRYFTRRNQENFYPGYFGSVFNDQFFNGISFKFSLPRGQDRNAERDRETYRYFWKGDTVTLKWCTIDKGQYEFWRTFEQDRNSRGNPFAAPTVINSNIKGGLGIWAGYGASYDTLIIPK